MAKKKRKVTIMTIEEKMHRALCALFVLQAAQLKMSIADIRRILGMATSDVNPIAKVINKALKKAQKKKK